MESSDLILILGAFKRSGTNHLRDLVCMHPDCVPSKIPEDFLPTESETLLKYANSTSIRWGAGCKPLMPLLLQNLCAAFLELLSGGEVVEHVVSKTPSTEGVQNVDKIFPGAKIIFIVRDGRDTVESGRRSWDWGIKEKADWWAQGVKRIFKFQENFPGRALMIRYEDLVLKQEETITKVLNWCRLDVEQYHWEVAKQAPVRGSSDLRHKFGEAMNWKPRQAWEGFSPIGRFASWNEHDIADFEESAGAVNRRLGYD